MRRPFHLLIIALNLAVVWALWSGHGEPITVGFGVGSCALVLWFTHRMGLADLEIGPYRLSRTLPLYLLWLLREIARSNLHVARVILSRRMPIRPQLLRVRSSQNTQLGQTIYANSITLTPGTLTLDVRDGSLLVHALTDRSAAGLQTGDMDARVSALERPRSGSR